MLSTDWENDKLRLTTGNGFVISNKVDRKVASPENGSDPGLIGARRRGNLAGKTDASHGDKWGAPERKERKQAR